MRVVIDGIRYDTEKAVARKNMDFEEAFPGVEVEEA